MSQNYGSRQGTAGLPNEKHIHFDGCLTGRVSRDERDALVLFAGGRMSNTGLWPREKPRPTDSHAELKVYEALSRLLPANWTAWHSLRIRTN